ncbi:MAG: hypothetical protein H6Q01_224, partial [Acidobacteria bacterium]|nr:hypothetical protein [Acidobacteriota bacterium]
PVRPLVAPRDAAWGTGAPYGTAYSSAFGPPPFGGMAGTSPQPPPMHDSGAHAGSLVDIERQRILEVLESTRWHRGRAADILGISVRTLYRKIKAFGLDREGVPLG